MSRPAATTDQVFQFVDLDGTLFAGDLGQTAAVQVIREQPWLLLLLPFWLLRGFAYTKQQLAARVTPAVDALPYFSTVLDELAERKRAGQTLILATASHRRWAEAVNEHTQLFDHILATDGEINLKGSRKLEGIQKFCAAHGQREFAYWGDSQADLQIWSSPDCVEAVTVNATPATKSALRDKAGLRHLTIPRESRAAGMWRLIRPHQWVKNLLLFLPMLLAHQWHSADKWIAGCWAFVAFSLAASGVYILNDLFDVQADRRHPVKRRRPFAAGDLPLSWGPPLVICFWLSSLICVYYGITERQFDYTRPVVTVGLIGYVLLNLLYTLYFKKRMIVDVFILAAMYDARVLIGGVVTEVEVSKWLLALSGFIFVSLAFAKRYAELKNSLPIDYKPSGRGYRRDDLEMIGMCGVAAGYLAVLVLAMYISTPEMMLLYRNKLALWAICPLLMYWITRLWFIARRGELDEDPILYAFRDRISLLTAAAVVVCTLAAVHLDRFPLIINRWWNG